MTGGRAGLIGDEADIRLAPAGWDILKRTTWGGNMTYGQSVYSTVAAFGGQAYRRDLCSVPPLGILIDEPAVTGRKPPSTPRVEAVS